MSEKVLSEAELSALKVTELAVMLKERGLNAKGKKAELVVRLLESQTAEVAESSNGSAVAAQGDAGAQSEVVATDHKRPRDELEEEKVHEAAVEDKAPLVAGGVCLVVTGLVRPFTEDQAKEFVSGGVELVSWKMPVSRAWALAEFKDAVSAAKALVRVNGVVWPAKNNSALKGTVYENVEMATAAVAPPVAAPQSQKKHREERQEKEEKKEKEQGKPREIKEDKAAQTEPVLNAKLKQTKTKPVLFYTHK